jgi:hypothetical protein
MTSLLEQLADEAIQLRQKGVSLEGIGAKHDAGANPTTIYTHGPGGILTFPGVDPQVFHTFLGAKSILGQIPTKGSNVMNPTYYILSGVRGDPAGQSEKDATCDDAPIGGVMKACLTTSVFGRYARSTREIDIARLGQVVDRADPMDLTLVGNSIYSQEDLGIFGNPASPTDLFRNEVARVFWERNVSFHRQFSKQLYSGNPNNNSANGGYREWTGLETLINTGHVDIEKNTSCPSVDSMLRNFAYGRVDQTGQNIVAQITNIFYQLNDRADRQNVMPVRWVIAMRPQLFYELTAIWPCSYLSFRCDATLASLGGTEARTINNIDSRDAVQFRDDMRQGKYLMIDGFKVPVFVDDGIPEDTNTSNGSVTSGCFASDIYFIPMSILGGTSTLYIEYFQWDNPQTNDALGNMILGRIDGPFITFPRQKNLCVQWQSEIMPRLILRTPWLAARLQNVMYCPIEHNQEPFPDDPYFVNGGRDSRDAPSYYNLWN